MQHMGCSFRPMETASPHDLRRRSAPGHPSSPPRTSQTPGLTQHARAQVFGARFVAASVATGKAGSRLRPSAPPADAPKECGASDEKGWPGASPTGRAVLKGLPPHGAMPYSDGQAVVRAASSRGLGQRARNRGTQENLEPTNEHQSPPITSALRSAVPFKEEP